ncbi:MAG: DUF4132 domain-containing protein [Deltaproteobacteria bacterium]|nr:DUF4132 domain-containing protein [Deltaproteobacteria bacterium]
MPTILRGLKAELDKQRPLGVLAAMPHTFERDSLDGFALALAQAWQERGENQRWLFDTLGPLGGERCVQFISQRLEGWSHQRAVQGIDHLVRIGSDEAIYAIITLALGNRTLGARRHSAFGALDIIAKQRDLADRDALIVAVYPKRGNAKVTATQRVWLEYLMLSGSRMSAAAFRRHVVGNPVRVPLAETLLWAECAGDRVLRTFRLGDGYEPQQDVGVVHPAELAPEEVDRLRRAFANTPQALLQLERPVFWLAQPEARTKALVHFAKRRVGFYAIQTVFDQRGWAGENDEDMHGTVGWSKHFPRDHAYAFATPNETLGSIGKVEVRDHAGPRVFDTLHVVTISELLWDLETAHGRAVETAPPPTAAASPPVVVERAKSGRSKCVVCTNAIEKDAVRLGVERTIETPSFTGLGLVWIHPDCAAGAPELAGIDIAALLQRA